MVYKREEFEVKERGAQPRLHVTRGNAGEKISFGQTMGFLEAA